MMTRIKRHQKQFINHEVKVINPICQKCKYLMWALLLNVSKNDDMKDIHWVF